MKERTSHSLFCMVAHFYQSITTLRTSNLIFQGRMGRVRCPWVPPGVTSARWEAETCIDPMPGWRRGAGRSLHWPSPLLRWSTSPATCLPFLSFHTNFPCPTFLQNFMLSPSVPSVLARARRCCMTPSPIRKEKRDSKWRHICCYGSMV